MARTTSGTLKLNADEKGLKFRALLPNNVSYVNDTFELVSRGDLNANSFAFFVMPEGQRWEKDGDGNPVRFITKIQRLSDVSVVTNAAYPDTELAARALEEVEREVETVPPVTVEEIVIEEPQQNIDDEIEKMKMKLKITKIKNEKN